MYDEFYDDSHLPPCPCENCAYRKWAKNLVRFIDIQPRGLVYPLGSSYCGDLLKNEMEQVEIRALCEVGMHPQCTIRECLMR